MFNTKSSPLPISLCYNPHTTKCTLKAACYKIHTTNCTLQTARYLLSTASCNLQTLRYRMQTANCTLQNAHYKLHTMSFRLDTIARVLSPRVPSRSAHAARSSLVAKIYQTVTPYSVQCIITVLCFTV